MNHIYRLVWNHAARAWVAVSEIARSGGKRSSAVLGAGLLVLPALAFGGGVLPSGGSVVRGQAAITQSGSHMQVQQATKNAVVNWGDFSIGKGASVHFENGSGATLNRVTGSLPSTIDGSLSATGAVYLVNRNGVIVGREGVINAAGFMATTLDVHDDAFMAGQGLRFFGDSRAGIVNLGSIQADSGNVALVAHSVRNEGTLRAAQGSVALLAGQEVFLASPDAPGMLISLGSADISATTGVENTGLIEAAQARMQAADGNLYALAINQSGVIHASGVENKDGRIVLTADGGTVRQNGSLSAHDAGGAGGEILVGGSYQGKGDAAVPNASQTIVTANARMDASATATQGDGGRVIVWADDSTAFAGRIAARGGAQGGDGGFAEVSGKRTLDFRPDAPIDLSAPQGQTGTVLLDPDEMTVVDTVTGANQVAAATVQAGLASADYIINTSSFDPASGSGDINVQSDITWNSANTLTLQAGNAIYIDANITAPNGALEMYAGRYAQAPLESGLDDVNGGAWLTAGHTIQTDRLRYGANASSLPPGYTLDPDDPGTDSFTAEGNLHTNTLELDLTGGKTGLEALGTANAIGTFRTVGSGSMGWVDITNHSGDLGLSLNSSDAFGLQITTPGNLTLQAGSQLNSTWGDFVLASTGGNFINNAGANALTFIKPGSGFLIYTGSPTGTTKGGLVGTEEFSRTFAGNPPDDYTDGTSRFLYRAAFSPTAQELTYRANDLSRHYGNTNPSLTYTVSGLQNGDVLQNVVTGAPLLSTTATQQSGVGQYAIVISQGTLASASYGFQFVGGTLTVQPAPVTIDIANLSRYYGDFNPTLTASASGLKNGDSLATALAGFTFGTSADRASNVGSYAITSIRNSGDVNANYSLTFNPGLLTITPTPVTLNLGNTSMVYGNALPNFLTAATLTGAYNGDTVATAFPHAVFSTAGSASAGVGSYAVTAASGLSNLNYLLTVGNLGTLTITKAPLVIHAANASRYYGDANPVFSVASATGWKNGDTLADIPGLSLTSATATSNVGSYAIVPTGSAANYEFVAGSGVLTVNKAPVDVYLNAATRYYGDADPQFTATYQGLKNGETALPGLYPVSNTNPYSPIGNYVISAGGGTTFQNYLPTFYAGVLTVAPRPLTVTAHDASRTYGASNPLLGTTVSGATAWDAAQAASFWVGETRATQRSDAGSYAITPALNPYGDSRFDNLGNYTVSFQPGTLTVNRALVQIRANPVSMVWGDDRPPLTYDITGWLMPWDDAATVNGQGKAQLTSLAGGTQAPPGLYPITLTNSALGKNYYAVLDGSPMVQVQRRAITIVGDYVVPSVTKIKDVHPIPMQPTPVIRYDGNGNASVTYYTAPLPGGPQFDTVASSNGPQGGDLFSAPGMPFIQPKLGTTMDDVLRYYDVTSIPGTAQVSLGDNALINRDWQPPPPEDFSLEVAKPDPLHLAPMWGSNPSIDRLFEDVDRSPGDLLSLYDGLEKGGIFKTLEPAALKLITDASAVERLNLPLLKQIADSEAWLARIKEEKPSNWQILAASIEADIAGWRAQLQPGGLDALRQLASTGDKDALAAIMPLLGAGLMQALEEGRLPIDAEVSLLDSINQQRTKLSESVDTKYRAFLAKQELHAQSSTVLFSGAKMPDIVGDAYIDLYSGISDEDIAQQTAGGGVALGTILGTAGVLIATTMGASGMTVAGTMSYAIAGLSAGGAASGVAAIAAAGVIIGVVQTVQVIESEQNTERYLNFKEQNQQLLSLDQLNLKSKDARAQAAAAIQTMLAKSIGTLLSAKQGN